MVVAWLSLCCLLVFSLVVLGGAVRLTGSGLSMVDWQPLRGAIPPLDQSQWQQVFENYRQFPEFKLVNPDMTLSGFKFIFWMEYAHRLLGRVTGVVFLLPFLFFLWTRAVSPAVAGRLWLLFFLGGAQGLLGWYMVQSGLVDDPRVSHYRLIPHFILAVIIYAEMLRIVAGLCRPLPAVHDATTRTLSTKTPATKTLGTVTLAVILLMMLSGALVAGTHAGLGNNTWPKMGTLWIPDQLLVLHPWWLNFLENTVTIQFIHRWLAIIVLLTAGTFALRLIRTGARPFTGYTLLAVALGQTALGITTLVLRVPTVLGVAHQAGAMLLLSLTVIALAGYLPSLARP